MRTENLDIRIMLNDKNITQKQIAKFLGVHEATVTRWLRNKNLKDDIRNKIISAANSIESGTTCPKRPTGKRIADVDFGGLNITIKELRKITGLSQSKFALKYHIPLKNLQRWEAGVYTTHILFNLYLLKRLITEVDYKEESDAWLSLNRIKGDLTSNDKPRNKV